MTVQSVSLVDALGDRYLSYALSTITQRSLPDVRDGLKPVHRRVLYAMHQLRLSHNTPPKKSARVVGNVIGSFHPHGEAAIYDALVRLAQDFSVRYPLIDGQGNFGNIDGDAAAAMRYTEARLTEFSEFLLEGLQEEAVDFRPTYDNQDEEPSILPAAFPNLLANGAMGIAVGMATSIPPHNLGELCEALIRLIRDPNLTTMDLMENVPGPDFPTGGVLIESKETILKAYETGRGSLRLRARWEVEKLDMGQYVIVVTEIPYQVQKSRLIEKIASLLEEKKLPFLADVRDESTEDIRLVLEPKNRNIDPAVLMESLFKATELESRFNLNMNVLTAEGVPTLMGIKSILRAFLDHRFEVLHRKTQHRLEKISQRLEILQGLLTIYLNLDEVISIIRHEDDPAAVLKARWSLSDAQVEAILNMRLRALRKLEEIAIQKELTDLSAEKEDLQGLLADPQRAWKKVSSDLKEIGKKFGSTHPLGRRRTLLSDPPAEISLDMDQFIEKESVTIICSEKGWVRTLKGHLNEGTEVKYKEGDQERFILFGETTDKLLVFTDQGRFFTLGVDKLPGGRGLGEPLSLMVDLKQEKVVSLLLYKKADQSLLVISHEGRGFQILAKDVMAQTRNGKNILTVTAPHKAFVCLPLEGDHVAFVGQNRKLLVIPKGDIPFISRGRGVCLQKYKDGALADVKCFHLEEGLTWKSQKRIYMAADLTPWLGKRAQSGRLVPLGFPKNNRF